MDTLIKDTHCPVCGYDLGFPAWKDKSPSDEICPSCGIQFGYNDAAGGDEARRRQIYQQWRQKWIAEGMRWNSVGISPPPQWDPIGQLRQIGISADSSK
jgi:hypothetical protein